jgi:hypothetical protein
MSLDFSGGSLNWEQLEQNLGADVKGTEKKSFKDDRFWQLARDENDNGVAIIRLLIDPEAVPYIQRYSHAIQSYDTLNKKKRWYINVSPETINEKCPASELWSKIFNSGTDESKEEARSFSRKIKYMCNIKVIKDPANPQNEGKIFLWEFGTKLKDKFMQALNPSEADRAMGEEPKQLFNPLTGCNIKLKIKKAAGFLNYDDTSIDAPSSIYDSAEEAKADILENAYKLSEFKSIESFNTYDELKSKLKYVMDYYTPKSMDEVQFKSIVTEFFDDSNNSSKSDTGTTESTGSTQSAPAEQSTPASQGIDIEPTPKVEPKAEPKSSSDDLDFLDDL